MTYSGDEIVETSRPIPGPGPYHYGFEQGTPDHTPRLHEADWGWSFIECSCEGYRQSCKVRKDKTIGPSALRSWADHLETTRWPTDKVLVVGAVTTARLEYELLVAPFTYAGMQAFIDGSTHPGWFENRTYEWAILRRGRRKAEVDWSAFRIERWFFYNERAVVAKARDLLHLAEVRGGRVVYLEADAKPATMVATFTPQALIEKARAAKDTKAVVAALDEIDKTLLAVPLLQATKKQLEERLRLT